MKSSLRTIVIIVLFNSFFSNAQKSLFYIPAGGIDTTSFDSTQLLNYHKLLSQEIYSSIHFVMAEPLDSNLIDTLGRFSISLPFLPCNNMIYRLENPKEIDVDNYSFVGKAFNINDTNCSSGDVEFIKRNKVIIAHVQDDAHSYEIYDLKDNVLAFCEIDTSIISGECEMDSEDIEKPDEVSACDDHVTKIIVFVSPAVMLEETDVPGKIALCQDDLNNIWMNSKIQNPITIVASYQYTGFVESGNINNDYTAFQTDPLVQALRAYNQAEVVVLLTTDAYGSKGGVTKTPFASFSNAYCLVVAKWATTSRHVFAHEVSHIFGACHDNDGTSDNTHGHVFKTGQTLEFGGVERKTLMCVLSPGEHRILHVSNPNQTYMNVATGNSYHNNAEEGVEFYKYKVGSFYMDGNNTPEIMADRVGCTKDWVVEANVCNGGPYTYSWYKKNFGITASYGTIQGTGSTFTINLPNAFMYVKCVIKNSSNVVVYTLSKFIGGLNCDNFREGNPSQINEITELRQENNDFVIFPNPSGGSFNIQFNSLIEEKFEIIILDVLGKEIDRTYVRSAAQLFEYTGQTQLAQGMYLIRINGATKNYSSRIIIK